MGWGNPQPLQDLKRQAATVKRLETERDELRARLAAATERADKAEAAVLLNVFYVINEAFSNCDLYAADAQHQPSAWALRDEIAEGLRALGDDPSAPRVGTLPGEATG